MLPRTASGQNETLQLEQSPNVAAMRWRGSLGIIVFSLAFPEAVSSLQRTLLSAYAFVDGKVCQFLPDPQSSRICHRWAVRIRNLADLFLFPALVKDAAIHNLDMRRVLPAKDE